MIFLKKVIFGNFFPSGLDWTGELWSNYVFLIFREVEDKKIILETNIFLKFRFFLKKRVMLLILLIFKNIFFFFFFNIYIAHQNDLD